MDGTSGRRNLDRKNLLALARRTPATNGAEACFLASRCSAADSGSEGVKRRNSTFQTLLVPSLNELGFPRIPKERDKVEQLLQELWTRGSCWRSPGPWWGGYNPEKYLNRWANIFSARDDLSFDVIGWAFFVAKCEVEYIKQKKLTAYDFLTAQKPRALLVRVAKWSEARLRYHRVGLQLTFYKRDALAGQEPITSNVEWLRQRLKHFVAVRTQEIQPEPHLNQKHYYTSSELDYLCWLHLVSPISEQWTLHEISKAVKKTFVDQSYYDFKKRWLAKPPAPLTYRVPNKNESPGEGLKRMTTPVGFEEAEADRMSAVLSNLRAFSDKVADLLADTGFRYTKRRGRAAKPRTETPSETDKSKLGRPQNYPDSAIEAVAVLSSQLATILQILEPLGNFEILGKKDLEKDEPKAGFWRKRSESKLVRRSAKTE